MNHALHECKDVRVLHFPLLDYSALIDDYERGPFEGRNLAAGARLYEKMINERDTIWLGVAGALVMSGFGGEGTAAEEADEEKEGSVS